MTKLQKLEYKLANAKRRIAGGPVYCTPDTSDAAKAHLVRRVDKLAQHLKHLKHRTP